MPTCLRASLTHRAAPYRDPELFATGGYGHARSVPSLKMALPQARRAREQREERTLV